MFVGKAMDAKDLFPDMTSMDLQEAQFILAIKQLGTQRTIVTLLGQLLADKFDKDEKSFLIHLQDVISQNEIEIEQQMVAKFG